LRGDHALEAAFMRYLEQGLREQRVVVNDQRDAVAGFEVVTIVGDFDAFAVVADLYRRRRERGTERRRDRETGPWSDAVVPPSLRLSLPLSLCLVDARQIERKHAAFAKLADDA